jgi:hypothetical protein
MSTKESIMQLDMHYYGTYAMARAAGMKPEAAQIVATAAQFVDDNAGKDTIEFYDGARIDVDATAHHTLSIMNLNSEDQRNVWIPFHFLPGDEGNSYTEKLICRKDSAIAKEMVKNNIKVASSKPYALELMGITAHVYADTFAHYGFSGISSRWNKVDNDSFEFLKVTPATRKYLKEKAEKFYNKHKPQGFFQNIKSWAAENASGALGHGSVLTYPDRPFLKWSYEYEVIDGIERPEIKVERDNTKDFMEGCEALHDMFRTFLDKNPKFTSGKGKKFAAISKIVEGVLSTQATKEGRIKAWQKVAKEGKLFNTPKEIPVYDERVWHKKRNDLSGLQQSKEAIDTPVYRYYQAAAMHRINILRDI